MGDSVEARLARLENALLGAVTDATIAARILVHLLTVDGSGSTLDADTLDGHDTSYFLAASSYTAADVLAKLLTVDGSGSGLDADTLDGHDTTYFTDAGNIVAGLLAVARGGTNIGSYAVGDLLYASGATALSKLADVATGNALISGGVTTAPAWGKVGLTTHVSGTLPIANGGTNATTAASALTQLGAAANAQVDIYTSGSQNWTIPTTAKRIFVTCIGGGGGGGGGRRDVGGGGSQRVGGGGGQAGGYSWGWFTPADLTDIGSTVNVTVGAAGGKGTGATVNSTDGVSGNDGGDSYFGPALTTSYVCAQGGKGGDGGGVVANATGGAGGTGKGQGNLWGTPGGKGGDSSTPATDFTPVLAVGYWGGGAGGGGAITTGGLQRDGAPGCVTSWVSQATAPAGGIGAGGSPNANGTDGAAGITSPSGSPLGGQGGGGGGSGSNAAGTAAGHGGNGGLYGGAGGGGGGSTNGDNAGDGGDGAAGVVVIVTFF